jgi:carbon-monoxide dehydrogenase medium subunit
VIPPRFDYVAPRELAEAVIFLEKHGDDAKVLAGGHSLIPLLRFRFANPKYLVDINRISDLEYMRESDGHLHMGSLTRYADVESSKLIQSKYAALSDAAGYIADPLVRNMGTVGGNVCHSDPANDLPAVMLALGASMIAVGRGGERVIPAEEFFVDTFQTALKPTELLKEILVPIPSARTGTAYLKLERGAGDFPVVGVAPK